MIHHGCSKVFRGAPVLWLITEYYKVFFRMSGNKSLGLTLNEQKAKQNTNHIPSDKMEEVVAGWLSEWSAAPVHNK